ncbi:substrate-binding periplasmic protein [Algibacillus agarilyticus]|uniref:substrate-binding periplasmic protein n=1 Tax=Algibacillus agarilyticus TaxID=2234133 RepID=UPI00130049DF|nr:transporter substrate-binding domain-containing protein [Algibacillus agarilyticus]
MPKLMTVLLVAASFYSYSNEFNYSELRFISVNEAPANFLNEKRELSGYVFEIVKRLQKQLNINTETEVLPEVRALRTLDTEPNVLMFSLSRTNEREDRYHWLAHVLSKRWIFYSLSHAPFEVSSIQQILASRTVGVVRGDIREKWLLDKNASNLVSALNYDHAVKMLMHGRFDTLFFESFGMYSTLKKIGYRTDSVRSLLVANESDVYIALSKSGTSKKLAEQLQKQFILLVSSEWYANHVNEWVKKLNAEGSADAWIKGNILNY